MLTARCSSSFISVCDYFLLLGDDVEVHTSDWLGVIDRAYHEQHARLNSSQKDAFPFGFGCLTFDDRACPRFPTFPVLHRTHLDIFPDVFPDAFVNQDADPWLFEVYRRWSGLGGGRSGAGHDRRALELILSAC